MIGRIPWEWVAPVVAGALPDGESGGGGERVPSELLRPTREPKRILGGSTGPASRIPTVIQTAPGTAERP